ncbi:hypothetical protein PRIPAC_95973 [Pristionchus pacificus]|uniref:Uncharacterized protein n=1 Tax=Pristionchus pacificus TaxID=54126 RepID=A0A2A6D1G7_PRIPA|nr:hypothetical protein PRIPAC_95973 [Pristionchus pacificus]|eukprot:PDM84141.1 hypothetical protein PRIPAC_34333 [Pristionchus pacificus]
MNYPGRLFCLSSLLTLLSHSLSSLRPGLTPSTESAPQCAEDEEEEYRGGRNGMEWNEEENRREEEGNYTINGPSEGEREEKGDGEERHGVRREMRLTGTRLERRVQFSICFFCSVNEAPQQCILSGLACSRSRKEI